MIKIYRLLTGLITLFVIACNDTGTNHQDDKNKQTANANTINEIRDQVSKEPVGIYDIPLKNNLNNWHFSVKLYQTKQRFSYLLDMQYEELRATDTIRFPNFNIEPTPRLQKGTIDEECIIGFLDKDKNFREYIKVFVDNDQLQVKQLKQYTVYGN